MHTKSNASLKSIIPVSAYRAFRLSLVVALSIIAAYALAVPLPYLTPIFAFLLCMKPGPALKLKALIALLIIICISLGVGLLLIPILLNYPAAAILIVGLGLYFSTYISVSKGQALLGVFLTMGVTLISASGLVNDVIAITVINSLCFAVAIVIIIQWVIYPLFPLSLIEDDIKAANKELEKPQGSSASNWIAIRATLIVLPVYFVTLTNPMMYMALIMKSVMLSQQSSTIKTKDAAKELLGSTFLAGCLAIGFWFLLDLVTTIWLYAAWLFLFTLYFVSKFYNIIATRYPPSFWQNVFITLLILVGPAVEDSANGNDVYQAFAIRMALLTSVTIYACAAVYLLEWLKQYLQAKTLKTSHIN